MRKCIDYASCLQSRIGDFQDAAPMIIENLSNVLSEEALFASATIFGYNPARSCLDAIGAQEVEDRLTNSTPAWTAA